MSILKICRLTVHPYVAITIVRNALQSFTQGDLNRDSRRRMSAILKVFADTMDPEDGNFSSPYNRLPRSIIEKQEKKNAELIAKHGDSGRFEEGFAPLPAPDLRVKLDFGVEDMKVIENAVEAYAKSPQVNRGMDQAFTDAFDAIDAALRVPIEVPTP